MKRWLYSLLFEIPEEIKIYHVILDILLGFFISFDGYNNHIRAYKKDFPREIEIKQNFEEKTNE